LVSQTEAVVLIRHVIEVFSMTRSSTTADIARDAEMAIQGHLKSSVVPIDTA